MEKLDRSELERILDVTLDALMELIDAQGAEQILRKNGFGNKHLEALGFEVK